jgi:ABC-type nitrate/sulfonate/bicarbonate transport system substrate-binding protein
MRRILIVALLASLCQGCFVLEEIDKGQQLMDQHSPRAREKAAQQEEAVAGPLSARPGAKQEEGILERLAKWWKKKREPAPSKRDPDDLVVRCQIGRTMHFTRKSDCMLRGGRVI